MKDNYFAAVGAIVLKDNKILLVRHTYGAASGKLLNPGGFIKQGELPSDALIREVLEETGVVVKPIGMLSLRCSVKDWYMVILAEYVSGYPKSDGGENSEAIFMDYEEALLRDDVTDTAKTHIKLALSKKPILPIIDNKERIMYAV